MRPAGYRFMPDGKKLVYVPAIHALDFWMLDLATMQSRALTRLSNRGTLRTFDITADGKQIIFDRLRQNSNIVVIDLPQRSPKSGKIRRGYSRPPRYGCASNSARRS